MKATRFIFMLKVLAICSILTSRRFELTSTSKRGNNSRTRFDLEEIREAYNGEKTKKNAEL